jgi:hypothetical protein
MNKNARQSAMVKMAADKLPRPAEKLYQMFLAKRSRQEYDSSMVFELNREMVVDTL